MFESLFVEISCLAIPINQFVFNFPEVRFLLGTVEHQEVIRNQRLRMFNNMPQIGNSWIANALHGFFIFNESRRL